MEPNKPQFDEKLHRKALAKAAWRKNNHKGRDFAILLLVLSLIGGCVYWEIKRKASWTPQQIERYHDAMDQQTYEQPHWRGF